MSLVLFLAGAGGAYFLAFDKVLAFLLSFNSMMGIDPDLRINEWMSFALLLPLAFGISFQLPLVMLFLERIGLFTVKTYLASWRMAVLVIFRAVDGPHAQRRSVFDVPDGRPAHGALFRRRAAMQIFPRGQSRAV